MNIKELKGELKKKTDKEPEKYYAVDTLKGKGFHRERCKNCGMQFWTIEESELCGEPECSGGYRFIGDPPTKKKLDFVGVWKEFSSLFKKLGYTPIRRYPVVAKWRDDTYWTNASIYDFQPHVVSGAVEPPANPLVVPQVCVRFNDIDNVGITGRHHTSFVMIGQHAFVPPEEYDINAYLDHIVQWLEQGMKIPLHEIKFHEDQWGGGGNLGPCMEFYARGLEVGNQVYMTYEVTEGGYKDLNLKVLDMGMGHERCAWISQGIETSYEANFPTVVKKLTKLTGITPDRDTIARFLPHSGLLDMEETDDIDKIWRQIADNMKMDLKGLKEAVLPLSGLYSIADHTRTLLFALNDGALPSNVGGAYNLRVVLRRALGFIDSYGWDVDLSEMCEEHAKYMKPVFPELVENLDDVSKILEVEKKKYNSTRDKSRKIVERLLEKGFKENELLELYDSQGVSPELLKQEAKKAGKDIEIPDDFYAKVAARHPDVEKKEKIVDAYNIEGVPDTEKLYYTNWKTKKFTAKVIKVIDYKIILDKTAFYPEGGGQLNDLGTLGGFNVTYVEKQGNVVIHTVDGKLKEGQEVEGKIDWQRRLALTRNHTGAHLVGGAARRVLGKHVWQAGSQIDLEKGRLDITHYEGLSEEEKAKIEELANKVIEENHKINKSFMNRTKAEQMYGFTLYQGGAVPGKEIRVVETEGWDVQACGGTHLDYTGEAEGIKLLKTEKIQDGVVRLVFVAGKEYLEEQGKEEKKLEEECTEILRKVAPCCVKSADLNAAAAVFSVQADQLPKTLERFLREVKESKEQRGAEFSKFCNSIKKESTLEGICKLIFEEWKTERKELKKREEHEADILLEGVVKAGKYRIVSKDVDDFGIGMKISSVITGKNPDVIFVVNSKARSAIMVGKNVKIDAKQTLNTLVPNSRISGDSNRAIADKPLPDLKKALEKIGELTS